MIRYKSFDSTGIAPSGVLFAGDLNAIQDAAAARADFTQTIDLATLRIGETGLQLLRYGTGEARLSGALRTDGILRALGGIYGGSFTTTQRNAIASGLAPYGLVILNSTTNQYEWNKGTDSSRNWQPFAGTTQMGTYALRPAANSLAPGASYFVTDQVAQYITDGANWIRTSTPAGFVGYTFATTPDPGWVLCDGSAWPGTTGIYTEAHARIGTAGGPYVTNLPDIRGRLIASQVPGGKAEVASIGNNDGLAVWERNIEHYHMADGSFNHHFSTTDFVGGGAVEVSGYELGAQTSGDYYGTTDQQNLNRPAYIVANAQMKL